MNENNGTDPLKPAAAGVARIVIDYNPQSGATSISGLSIPPIMFLGMIELAKMAMMDANAKAERIAAAPSILSPHEGVDIDALSKFRG